MTGDRSPRLVSLDAYRGLVMLFMASNGLGLARIAREHPDSRVWQWVGYHTSHAAWVGGGAWDMIQPSFMFMVGMAVPFSLARRAAAGQSAAGRLLHAAWRAAILVALGVFLASNGKRVPEFIFTNVLAQIGLGYVFVVALAGRGWHLQTAAIAAIAAATWAAFAWHPLPGPELDPAAVGITPELARAAVLPGFFGHWSMNTNLAAAVDRWLLNLFPREQPFVFNAGGYQTLNFVPSIITMLLGLMAGERLRGAEDAPRNLRWLLGVGAACLAAGLVAHATCCPIVKRIWTPSWALVSGGVSLWLVAALRDLAGLHELLHRGADTGQPWLSRHAHAGHGQQRPGEDDGLRHGPRPAPASRAFTTPRTHPPRRRDRGSHGCTCSGAWRAPAVPMRSWSCRRSPRGVSRYQPDRWPVTPPRSGSPGGSLRSSRAPARRRSPPAPPAAAWAPRTGSPA